MVLVPGPHLLNGAIDLMRARITLGIARLAYGCITVLAISSGLLIGLALGGTTLPATASGEPARLVADIVSAGIAVAAYGVFFSMPWRMLPVPVVIGMLAHALRWIVTVVAGASPMVGALVACLLVGTLMTPIGYRLRLPFAALGFASVVSLIPGVFLFRMAGGLVALVLEHPAPGSPVLMEVASDAMTALLIMLAMTIGLMLPKMLIDGLRAEK
jgi:uncharacterized membrane protein YjjB (DUF3815 family)